jgi:S1-C subfamily serine protease
MILVLHDQQELREQVNRLDYATAQVISTMKHESSTQNALKVRIDDLELGLNYSGILSALANTVTVLHPNGSHGSGVVLMDGYVLTAGHCSGVTTVKTLDGAVYGIESGYVHPRHDVMILHVPGIEGSIRLAQEPELLDCVYVIGTPFDHLFEGTISKGVFTHHDRDVWYWRDAYQVTCVAGPGSSGGPVVNTRGQLIGIVVGGPDPGSAVTICESIAHIIEALIQYE